MYFNENQINNLQITFTDEYDNVLNYLNNFTVGIRINTYVYDNTIIKREHIERDIQAIRLLENDVFERLRSAEQEAHLKEHIHVNMVDIIFKFIFCKHFRVFCFHPSVMCIRSH